jgi:hypothetical protein
MYDLYFTVRLLEELRCAERARGTLERLVHLQACRHYQGLLTVLEMSRRSGTKAAEVGIDGASQDEPY